MTDLFSEIRKRVEAEEAVAVATVVQSPLGIGERMVVLPDRSRLGEVSDRDLEDKIATDALEQLRRGTSKTVSYHSPNGETLVFFDVYPSPNRLLVFGGVHIAVPLVEFAKPLGFRVTVIDARGRFATRERFPRADEIVLAYADEYLAGAHVDASTYVVVLTHDPKLDDPALIHALATEARYVGAIGSRKTHAKRVDRLREAGLTEEQINRIHAPIGLDIDAQNPEEIALAIMAEMIAAKNGAVPTAARVTDRGSAEKGGSGARPLTPVP